jgi:hypothetical protein
MKVCRLGVGTFVLILVLSGCGTWTVVGGRHYSSGDRYEANTRLGGAFCA